MIIEICMFLIRSLSNFKYIYKTLLNSVIKCKKYTFNLILLDKVFYLNTLKGDDNKLEKWIQLLISETKELMNNYYCIDSAMEKIWDKHYCAIITSDIDIHKLRTTFWEDGFNLLEEYNEEILNRYEEVE